MSESKADAYDKENWSNAQNKATNTIDKNGRQMTLKLLRKICLQKGGYDTPDLNDSLYLNFEGFTKIENLNEYFNIKSLFLEGNCINKIENLNCLKELRALCLKNNMVCKIENLTNCFNLRTLDLSNNNIKTVEGIENLKFLDTLNLHGNIIQSLDDVKNVLNCTSLTTLELSNNKIDDCGIIDLLSKMQDLRSLYLKGNPFLNKMDFYRKNAIGHIGSLTFLDDRPVFENERRLNNAWIHGGKMGEENERKLMQREKSEQKVRRMESRRQAQLRYQARVAAMQERLRRNTINEDQEYTAQTTNGGNIDVTNTTSTDMKDNESDDIECSEDSQSWTVGYVEGTSEDSFDLHSSNYPSQADSQSVEHSPSSSATTTHQQMFELD